MEGTILKCAEQNILRAGFCISQWEFGNHERRIISQEKVFCVIKTTVQNFYRHKCIIQANSTGMHY